MPGIFFSRFQHPERFEEILKNYVLRPSQEEFEKMRVVLLQTYAGQVPEEEWKKMKEQVEKLNSEHAPPPLNLRPPGEIKSKHLEGQYAFCFEYYWMSPNRENCYLHYEETLAKALNQFKERTRGVDMRDLIEKKMKTFDPRKAPNFKLLED